MPISKEPILYPLVSSTSSIPTSESFTFDWNWGLHKVLSTVTGLVKFIPGIGMLAGPYSELLNYVYGYVIDDLFPPTDSNNQSTTDYTLLFQTLMAAAEQMMDAKIEDAVKSDATTELQTLHKDLSDFHRDLNNLANPEPDSDISKLQEAVRTQFKTTESSMVRSIEKLSRPGYETILLSSYAQAANMHLLLLREVYLKGEVWGFDHKTVTSYYDAPDTKNGFKQLIKVYTDYCMQHYQNGLTKIKSSSVNLCAAGNDKDNPSYYNQYLFDPVDSNANACHNSLGTISTGCGGYHFDQNHSPICASKISQSRIHSNYMQSIANWNQYNEYIQTMQVTVLDLVAIWPYWDPTNYLTDAKKELTREVYFDIKGSPDGTKKDIDTISQELLPQPRLFTTLNSIDIGTERYEPEVDTYGLHGVTRRYHYIKGDIFVKMDQHFTLSGTDQTILHPQGSGSTNQTIDMSTIDGIGISSWFEPRTIQFNNKDINGNSTTIGTVSEDTPFNQISNDLGIHSPQMHAYGALSNSGDYLRGLIMKMSDHQISYVKFTPTSYSYRGFVNTGRQLGALTVGWTSTTVDIANKVQKGTITSIPAVKSHSITDWGTGTVVKGPGHTGGDLVKLPSQTRAKMVVNIEDTSTSYDVRIRYAAPSGGHIQFSYWNGSSDVKVADTQLQNTGGNTNFEHFQYAMLTTNNTQFKAPFSPVEILIENIGDSDVYLDKIEFIPYQVPSENNLGDFSISPFDGKILWQNATVKNTISLTVNYSPSDAVSYLLFFNDTNGTYTARQIYSSPFKNELKIPEGFTRIELMNMDSNRNISGSALGGNIGTEVVNNEPTTLAFEIPNQITSNQSDIIWKSNQGTISHIDLVGTILSNSSATNDKVAFLLMNDNQLVATIPANEVLFNSINGVSFKYDNIKTSSFNQIKLQAGPGGVQSGGIIVLTIYPI
ncbi:hypothetical protein ABE47_31350 [Bacillus thuringiensis]|uniref:insecticidal delta-endotoxin Cry8Ea1 family protein n=1 Tax=Bacillus thuringiensis TaxID=1428 RepID=UPI0018CE95F2|nr:insecticidal delta-endotoxin Cry8Ea1 family protein [Bacillus thuringiensis]MBG9516447.1 hypothetical protein [Bacillus thuringiensis]